MATAPVPPRHAPSSRPRPPPSARSRPKEASRRMSSSFPTLSRDYFDISAFGSTVARAYMPFERRHRKERIMFAITAITGKVGGAVARTLLNAGLSVRAVVRDEAKAAQWTKNGCEIAIADADTAGPLAAALEGVEGAFILLPPVFDPGPDFAE